MRPNPTMPTNRQPSRSALLLLIGAALAAAIGPIARLGAQDPAPTTTPGLPGPGSVLIPPGQAAQDQSQPPPTPAEQAIDDAIAKLRATESIAADLTMDVRLLDQTFEVEGVYLKSPGNRMLLRLDVKGLGDIAPTYQQVSNGSTVYQYQESPQGRDVRGFQLTPILEILNRPAVDPEFRALAIANLGFGGPETLLEGFRKVALFDQLEESELEGVPVLILRGHWTDLAALGLPGAQGTPGTTPDTVGPTFLPGYVPSIIELTIGKADGWPYEVGMLGKAPSILLDQRTLGPDGRPIGRKSAAPQNDPTAITLRYRKSGREPRPEDFQFQPPPDLEVFDTTDSMVADLTAQVEQAEALRRQSGGIDPLEGPGELLDTPIDAPRPDPSGSSPSPPPAPAPNDQSFRSSIPAPG